MSQPNQPTCTGTSWIDLLNCGAGAALQNSGTSVGTLLAAISGGAISFGVQLLVFMLIRLRLSRIYRPRTYLVPERERVPAPPPGVFAWLPPLFHTPNVTFIQKCGLDAYFFLRYLRTMLLFFLLLALIILPILLPLNRYSGGTAQGLNQLSISNIGPQYAGSRLWAHMILAIGVILWFCYVVHQELRGYIRVRQAYLTSPQHRLRASATTVLVTGIPRKWLSLEALDGLYDVFPGGIKNIWINRNFDELSDKVEYREKLAKQLEAAETNLITTCRKKHEKAEQAKAKKEGMKKKSKAEKRQVKAAEDAAAERMAEGSGVSEGDQHATPHGLQDILHDAEDRDQSDEREMQSTKNPFARVGQGLGAVGYGLGAFGKGVGTLGQKVVGDVDAGIFKVGHDLNHEIEAVNDGSAGFAVDEELYRQSHISQSDVPPTPPPKTPATERAARMQKLDSTGAPYHTPLETSTEEAPPVKQKPHPLTLAQTVSSDRELDGTSDKTLRPPDLQVTRRSVESKPKSPLQIEEPFQTQKKLKPWQLFDDSDLGIVLPSPQPHTTEEDEFPLNGAAELEKQPEKMSGSKWTQQLMFWKNEKKDDDEDVKDEYPDAFVKDFDENQDGEPRWKKYIEPKDRPTMRLPIINQTWFPSIPFVGKKVDSIYHLRQELARLNLEIEIDQSDVEKFPFMNSAFIQFNHQVAAHMACQSLSHHVPQHMAPRLVEISPDDIIWDNMSVKWWERYLRTGIVLLICAGLIFLYAVPVAFTSLLSHVSLLAPVPGLHWLARLPKEATSIIQGLLPPILLNVILMLVPMIFRLLVTQQGVPTGNSRDMGVQTWYFAFLFIQVFFIATLSSGIVTFIPQLAKHPGQVVRSLATSLPEASTYFFSYLLVQALSNSASALVQISTLLFWFILGPILDSTPRQKFHRHTKLNDVQWGTFFPPFTNFAVIGIIYSVIAPLILVFMLIIFGLFWIVYKYNVLYVYQFRNDTGGLMFPTAINQLFTGIYFMEICLIGYFFISQGPDGKVACIPQAVIMIVVTVFTVLYQWQLNKAFNPLLQYLPITLEDEAVIRDEEFARAQESKFAPLNGGIGKTEDNEDIQEVLKDREQREEAADDAAKKQERRDIEEHRRSHNRMSNATPSPHTPTPKSSWHQQKSPTSPTWKTDRWREAAPQAVARIKQLAEGRPAQEKPKASNIAVHDVHEPKQRDVEAQHTVGDILYSGFAEELEDLTPEERDLLVRYAFQHSALRAKRPVVWIPRDKLGVSDDEIRRAKKMSTVEVVDEKAGGRKIEKTNIWMSNEGTALDAKGRVVFRRSPPDFSNVDLIAL